MAKPTCILLWFRHGANVRSGVAALCTFLWHTKLGFKTAVGMPFKDIATSDSIYLEEAPGLDDKAARTTLRRMQEVRRA